MAYNFNLTTTSLLAEMHHDELFQLCCEEGGTVWYCEFSFAIRPAKSEVLRSKYIVPYFISLAKKTKSVITPFIGEWDYWEDRRHRTHWHSAFHCTSKITDDVVKSSWKKRKNKKLESIGRSYVKPYDFDKKNPTGMEYIYGSNGGYLDNKCEGHEYIHCESFYPRRYTAA